MNWYRIPPCPNYAISEDGQSVKNITTDQLLNHNVAPYAKDGLRRVTLRRKSVYHNKVKSAPKVYTLESLKEFIKEENKLWLIVIFFDYVNAKIYHTTIPDDIEDIDSYVAEKLNIKVSNIYTMCSDEELEIEEL